VIECDKLNALFFLGVLVAAFANQFNQCWLGLFTTQHLLEDCKHLHMKVFFPTRRMQFDYIARTSRWPPPSTCWIRVAQLLPEEKHSTAAIPVPAAAEKGKGGRGRVQCCLRSVAE
jgi:hypothetical protein